jgi:hypothetical protein
MTHGSVVSFTSRNLRLDVETNIYLYDHPDGYSIPFIKIVGNKLHLWDKKKRDWIAFDELIDHNPIS